MHHLKILKSYYKITPYADMLRWWPPPSAGKVHPASWNTAAMKQCPSCYAFAANFTSQHSSLSTQCLLGFMLMSGVKWIFLRVHNRTDVVS
jgi:hypothetical protein